MSISNSKRSLIFGRTASRQFVRPPWAIAENDFTEVCNRCGECVKQCPSHVIRIASGGFPEMNFSEAGCDFCRDCVEACQPDALKYSESAAFDSAANIGDKCLAEQGVVCRSCGEVCEVQAIEFRLVVGGITHVSMATDLCNGCGECVSVCPAHAITVEPVVRRA